MNIFVLVKVSGYDNEYEVVCYGTKEELENKKQELEKVHDNYFNIISTRQEIFSKALRENDWLVSPLPENCLGKFKNITDQKAIKNILILEMSRAFHDNKYVPVSLIKPEALDEFKKLCSELNPDPMDSCYFEVKEVPPIGSL